jgi:hypothetical protein
MIYTNPENEIYYYTAQPVGDVFYDLYIFTSMTRNAEAVRGIIDFNAGAFRLTGSHPQRDSRYRLTLDFLANGPNPTIEAVLPQLIAFFQGQGLNPIRTNAPLRVIIEHLTLETVLDLIQSNEFQAYNNLVSGLHASVWRLTKEA